MNTIFKNQIELALALRDIIDKYYEYLIPEEKLKKYLQNVAYNNSDLLFKDGDYTSAVKLKLGVKGLGC